MAWFSKKTDPITDRARALESEIAALEQQINRLDAQLVKGQAGAALAELPPQRPEPAPAPAHEPIFEDMNIGRLEAPGGAARKPEHFNELGVRKYDLPALVSRLKNHVRGPAATNPKLVSYLAAGGIQGLRPMRYEKRVARNRFILLALVLFVILVGIVAAFVRQG